MVNRIQSVWARTTAWIAGTVAVIAAAAYAIGGREFFRGLLRARSRAEAFLQPPTQAEIQRAAATNPGSTTSVGTLPQVPPVTVGEILFWCALIIAIIVALFYLTGRPRRERARARGQ